MTVKRAFTEIVEGQIHYWRGGPTSDSAASVPLVFLHPGPGTARHQVPLLNALAAHVDVIAPDMLGMGDSAPPDSSRDNTDMAYFADATFRFLDSLGLSHFILMGSSLGGRLAVEMALRQPNRVKGLVLNRIMMIAGEDLSEMKLKHAPQVMPDQTGAYIWFVWNRLRDLVNYFPWFKRDPAHQRNVALPPADVLHISFIEHIKMCATSHTAFTAYWNYPIADKLPGLKVPVMCRAETAAFVPGATEWKPGYEGDVLMARPEQLGLIATAVVDYVKTLKA